MKSIEADQKIAEIKKLDNSIAELNNALRLAREAKIIVYTSNKNKINEPYLEGIDKMETDLKTARKNVINLKNELIETVEKLRE